MMEIMLPLGNWTTKRFDRHYGGSVRKNPSIREGKIPLPRVSIIARKVIGMGRLCATEGLFLENGCKLWPACRTSHLIRWERLMTDGHKMTTFIYAAGTNRTAGLDMNAVIGK